MDRLVVLKNMLKEDPSDNFTRYAIALEYAGLNENDSAREILSELLNNNPEYLAAYYQYGKLLEENGELEKAESVYKNGIDLAEKQKDMHTKNELQEALDNL